MRQTIKYSICAAVAIMIVGMLMFQSIPDKLLRLFDASEEMLRLGIPALRIISISFPLAGFGIGAGSVFQALGYSVYSMIVSLIRQLVVLIPCAYAIGRVTGDVTGVWWAFVIAGWFLADGQRAVSAPREPRRDPHPLIRPKIKNQKSCQAKIDISRIKLSIFARRFPKGDAPTGAVNARKALLGRWGKAPYPNNA